MRRITLWLMGTVSALVLLFSYHTSTSSKVGTNVQSLLTGSGTETGAGAGGAAGGAGEAGGVGAGAANGGGGTSSASTSRTVAGDTVTTRWGDVQVQLVFEGTKIVKAEVLQVPWNNREDQQINANAVPILNDEVVSAQSGQIDTVSGATVTSGGYIGSLQSAIDKAKQ